MASPPATNPEAEPPDTSAALRWYGRRKGKPLRPNATARLTALLPHYQLTLPLAQPIGGFFPDAQQPLWLEVGFGNGAHLASLAAAHPQHNFIGAEPFINGVASLLQEIEQQQLQNIRIFADDARLLLAALPPASLAGFILMFPDPWPKKRHAERRFINPENLAALARVLALGAEVRFASDHPALAEWMQTHVLAHPAFVPATGTEHGRWPTRPMAWPTTRYEQKQLAGPAQYFGFVRKEG